MMKAPSQDWRVVLASMVSLMVGTSSMIFYTQGLFLQPMIHDFGWAPSGYFSAVLVSGVAGALLIPLVGKLADRFSIRALILGGVVFFAAGNVALGLIGNSLPIYIFVMAVTTVFGIPQTPLLYAKVISTWFDERRGTALAVAFCGNALGGIIVPPFTSLLILDFGWRVARYGLAGMVLLFALPTVFIWVREKRSVPVIRNQLHFVGTGAEVSLKSCLRSSTLWCITGAFFLAGGVANSLLVHLVPLLMKEGVSLGKATTALSVLAAAQVVGRFAAGAMLDRFQTPKVGVLWLVPAALGIALLLELPGAVATFPAAILVGLSYGAELEISGVFISRIFGLTHFAFLYAIVFGAYVLGASVGPTVVAVLVNQRGSYAQALLFMLWSEAVALVLVLMVQGYRYLPEKSTRGLPANN